MSREYALSVRLAAAAEKITTPPATPMMRTSASVERTPERSPARARMKTALMIPRSPSFRPQHDGGLGLRGRPPRKRGDQVGEEERRRREDEGRGEWNGNRWRDPHLVGEEGPEPPSRGDTERDPQDQSDDREGGGLPAHSQRHLTLHEPERLQHCEVAPASSHRRYQGVPDHGCRKEREDDCQNERGRANLRIATHVGWQRVKWEHALEPGDAMALVDDDVLDPSGLRGGVDAGP